MATFQPLPANPISASAFLRATANKSPSERDSIAANLVIKGNFPSFLRKLVPVKIGDNANSITIRVMPNYMCIGNDSDYMIWAFSAPQGQRIADAFQCVIPTVKLSEEIYKHSAIKLEAKTPSMVGATIDDRYYSPAGFVASKHMLSPQGIKAHNDLINEQLNETGNYAPGTLVRGHKKSIVLDDSVPNGRLGMHGLYDSQGKPLQAGALTKHDNNHIEYAMGLELVDRKTTRGDLLKLLRNGAAEQLVGKTQATYSYDKQSTTTSEMGQTNLRPMSNYPNDPTTGAPKGYYSYKQGEKVPDDVGQMAKKILDKFIGMSFGTVIPFKSNGKYYMARVEPHSNKPRGITVYKKIEGGSLMPKNQIQTPNDGIMSSINKYYEQAKQDLASIVGL